MRKKNSLLNFITGFVPFVILMFFGFWKVNVWQTNLGADVFALNQLFFQLFAYLSLMEAGIGALVQKEYYNLFVDRNEEKIKIYYTLSKRMLRIVALMILLVGFVLSFFLKYLTNGTALSLPYMQTVFMIFLAKSVVDYVFCAPRYVLQADQKIYKINILMNVYRIIEAVIEVFFIMYGYGYMNVLLATFVVRVLLNLHANKIVYKEYPWLKTVKDTKGITIHGMSYVLTYKIVTAIQDSTDVMLISAFINPLAVTIYSSYKYITKYLNDFITMFGTALTSSLGNLMYSTDKKRSLEVFETINALFFFIAAFLTVALYFVTNSFIVLWVGPDKLIDTMSFYCLLIIFYHNVARRPLLVLKDVYALYKETQGVFVAEAIANFVLSILAASQFGITGILVATVVSTLLTNYYFFPKSMYKQVFNMSCNSHVLKYTLFLGLTGLLCFISHYFISFMNVTGYFEWFLHSVVYCVILLVVLFVIFYLFYGSFRDLTKQGIDFIYHVVLKK